MSAVSDASAATVSGLSSSSAVNWRRFVKDRTQARSSFCEICTITTGSQSVLKKVDKRNR